MLVPVRRPGLRATSAWRVSCVTLASCLGAVLAWPTVHPHPHDVYDTAQHTHVLQASGTKSQTLFNKGESGAGKSCDRVGPGYRWEIEDIGDPDPSIWWGDCHEYSSDGTCTFYEAGRRRRQSISRRVYTPNFLCVACSKGKYMDKEATLHPGQPCRPCAHGRYADTEGAISCKACLPGTYVAQFASVSPKACKECRRGFVQWGNAQPCKPCPAGQFQNAFDFTQCHQCSAGQFQDESGKDTCKPCGSWVDAAHAVWCKCAAGSVGDQSAAMAGTCTTCPQGKYASVPNLFLRCQVCPSGKYQHKSGHAACQLCPLGQYHEIEEQRSVASCKLCPNGKYQVAHVAQRDPSTCKHCPFGLLSDPGAPGHLASCGGCGQGKYKDVKPATHATEFGMPGSNSCADDSAQPLMALSECQSWCKTQGGGCEFEYSGSWNVYPRGCHIDQVPPHAPSGTRVHVYFNTHPTGGCGDACRTRYRSTPICARKTTRRETCKLCPSGMFQNATFHRHKNCEACKQPRAWIPDKLRPFECRTCAAEAAGGHNPSVHECFCKPGFFGPGTSCRPCPVGRYTDTMNRAAECEACPAGQIQHPETRTTCGCGRSERLVGNAVPLLPAGECLPCEAGRYNDLAFSQRACKHCPTGRFGTAVGSAGPHDDVCMLCKSGQYHVRDRTSCKSCPAGLQATQDRTGCECIAGRYTRTCDPIQASCSCELCNQPHRHQPTPNIVFSYSGVGDSYVLDIPADVELALSVASDSDGRLTALQGATNRAHTCHYGCAVTKRVSSDRLRCECTAGKFLRKIETGAEECSDCPAGQFQPDHSNFQRCIRCPKGKFQDHAGNARCRACLEGKFRDITVPASKQERHACVQCYPGQWQDQRAQISCKKCAAGKHQDLEIDNHEQLPSACIECLAEDAQFQPLAGMANCETCGAGRHRNIAISSTQPMQEACPHCSALQGEYQDGVGQLSCKTCAVGRFRDVAVSSSASEARACPVCASGRYQERSAQLRCNNCTAGRHQPQAVDAPQLSRSSTRHSCQDCMAGQYQQYAARTACVECKAGTFQDISIVDYKSKPGACLVCTLGQYQNSSGQTQCRLCLSCPGGKERIACGPETRGTCNGCAAGRFKPAGQTAWNSTCTPCAPHQYQPYDEQVTCLSCTSGKLRALYAADARQSEAAACLACPDGEYQDGPGAVNVCKACAKGRAQRMNLRSRLQDPAACVKCAPGHYQQHKAQTHCNACARGRYQDETQSKHHMLPGACKPCAAGRFQSLNGSTTCAACAEGHYQDLSEPDRLFNPAACKECTHGRFQGTPAGYGTSAMWSGACESCPEGRHPNVVQQPALLAHFQRGFFNKSWHVTANRSAQLHGSPSHVHSVDMLVPFGSSSYAFCREHNTAEHACFDRRQCRALTMFRRQRPPQNPAPSISPGRGGKDYFTYYPSTMPRNMDSWCDFQCASAPDRWNKTVCPSTHHAETHLGQMCTCFEKRISSVRLVSAQRRDKECNHPQVCSHVYCKIETHHCNTTTITHRSGHLLHKLWAMGHSHWYSPPGNCGGTTKAHRSIRIYHHGSETTCKSGHFCFARGEQCLCVQMHPSRPDTDRCWYSATGHSLASTQLRACYRRCLHARDQAACSTIAAHNFKDTEKPEFISCGSSSTEFVSAIQSMSAHRQWLCRERAFDDIDGDITDKIMYDVMRTDANVAHDILAAANGTRVVCKLCTLAKANQLLAAAGKAGGNYSVNATVCDDAGNCASSIKFVVIASSGVEMAATTTTP